jgi:hypothetical protein
MLCVEANSADFKRQGRPYRVVATGGCKFMAQGNLLLRFETLTPAEFPAISPLS